MLRYHELDRNEGIPTEDKAAYSIPSDTLDDLWGTNASAAVVERVVGTFMLAFTYIALLWADNCDIEQYDWWRALHDPSDWVVYGDEVLTWDTEARRLDC